MDWNRKYRSFNFLVILLFLAVFLWGGNAVYNHSFKHKDELSLLNIEIRTVNIRNILKPVSQGIQERYKVNLPPIKLSLDLDPANEPTYGFLIVDKQEIHIGLSWRLFYLLNDEEIAAVITHELGHVNLKNLSENPAYYYHYLVRDTREEIKADYFTAQFLGYQAISSAIIKLSPPWAEQEKEDRLLALSGEVNLE